MKEGYTIQNQEKIHFITTTVVDWIDIFTRRIYKDAVVDCLNHCIKNKGMVLYGYVIMSNHIHLILRSRFGKLSDLIRDFKKFTSKTVLEKINEGPESRKEWMLEHFKKATETHTRNKSYQFWQYSNHAEEIYSSKFMRSKLNYVHMNPVRAGIVVKASHYKYSSASNYIMAKNLMTNELMDGPIVEIYRPSSFLNFEKH